MNYAADGQNKNKKLSSTERFDLVKTVRENVEASWEADRYNRTEAETDLRFLAGDQWPREVRETRKGRPMLTLNRLPQFLRQVTNDIRQADLSIKAAPVDSQSDPELAKVFDGIIKQILYASSAHWVFSCAAEHQSACGIGWFRIKTCYASDRSFDQEIRVERIIDPLSVYDDPGAMRPDRSDAMWRAVVENMPLDTFKAKYPKASVNGVDVPNNGTDSGYLWQTQDTVRVAEYWRKVPIKKEIALMPDGSVLDMSDLSEEQMQFLPAPQEVREIDSYRVEQFIVTGAEVLDGPNEWAGTIIPIVPVIGAEIPIDGQIVRSGVIRAARDPQQLYNFSRSAAAEAIALAPKAPFVATAKQIGPFKHLWDTHNTENRPYLLFDNSEGLGPPKREHPPETPQALYQECQLAAEDMKATTGLYDAALGNRSNESSGIAIQRRQMEGDVATYHFADNLQFSLECAGRILIELIPKIYDNERVIRILGEGDEEQPIAINQVVMGQDGEPVMLNDLSTGHFDVQVSIGPSQTTRRVEAANAILEFMKAIPPEQAAQLSDLVAKNSDWAGADEIAKRLRNMINPAVLVDPDDPQAPQPPDPTQDPAFQAEMREKEAKVEKDLAGARKDHAAAEKTEMENAFAAEQHDMGLHPTQHDPMQDKLFDAEMDERSAERSQYQREQDRGWSVEDQQRQAVQERYRMLNQPPRQPG